MSIILSVSAFVVFVLTVWTSQGVPLRVNLRGGHNIIANDDVVMVEVTTPTSFASIANTFDPQYEKDKKYFIHKFVTLHSNTISNEVLEQDRQNQRTVSVWFMCLPVSTRAAGAAVQSHMQWMKQSRVGNMIAGYDIDPDDLAFQIIHHLKGQMMDLDKNVTVIQAFKDDCDYYYTLTW